MKSLSTLRDVLLFALDDGHVLVSATDSCGSIGTQKQDALQVSAAIAGAMTAKVALMEILAVGATPLFVSVPVASSPAVANTVLQGVQEILGHTLPLMTSSEKNMPTSQTSFGVTITGLVKKEALRVAKAKAGDRLYCAGFPLLGKDVLENEGLVCTAKEVQQLFDSPTVHSILPVGSQGVAKEANILAKESALQVSFFPQKEVNLYTSAGPSTCVLFAAPENEAPVLRVPISCIGQLIK